MLYQTVKISPLVQLGVLVTLAPLILAAPFQRPPFDPKSPTPIEEYTAYTTPERFPSFKPNVPTRVALRAAPLPVSVQALVPPEPGSWLSGWRMPWSANTAQAPSTQAQLERELQRLPPKASSEVALRPVTIVGHQAIKLPDNGWSADAIAQMRAQQKGRPFYVQGQKGAVWLVRPNGVSQVTGASKAIVNDMIERFPHSTVTTPAFARQAAQAGSEARSGLSWMQRLTQGAKGWFGSATRYFKPI